MIQANEWKGETVFILGGGPSLKQHDISKLIGRRVIATNNAYTIFPTANLLHFADTVWFGWHKNVPAFTSFAGYRTTASQGGNSKHWAQYNIIHLRKEKNKGLSTHISKVCGNNAGHQALNIAFNMGAKEIVLLGFDMKLDKEGNTHWHKDHRRMTNTSMWNTSMIPGFSSTIKQLADAGVKVYNTYEESAIRCFPFRPFKDFIR